MFKLLFRLLYAITTFAETVIIFRIILKIINADGTNTLVSWVYNLSDYLISPFEGVVAQRMLIDKFQIELTPIIALIFYIIVAFVFSELGRSFKRTE